MTLECQACIGFGHAVTIVDNLNRSATGINYDDMDMAGTGIDGILNQLLDNGSRALDNFASSYLIGDGIREKPDNVTHSLSFLSFWPAS